MHAIASADTANARSTIQAGVKPATKNSPSEPCERHAASKESSMKSSERMLEARVARFFTTIGAFQKKVLRLHLLYCWTACVRVLLSSPFRDSEMATRQEIWLGASLFHFSLDGPVRWTSIR